MFNLGMNQNAQAAQQNQTQNNRFYPATQSLNKNADGFVVSINMTQSDITKSRFESRLEWLKSGRPQTARPTGMTTGPGFGLQGQQAPGQFMSGGMGQQNKFPTQPTPGLFPSTQQGGLFQTSTQPVGGILGGPTTNTIQPSLFSLGGAAQNTQLGMAQQPTGMFGNLGGQAQIGGLLSGGQQTTGLFGQAPQQQLGGLLGQIGQQQQLTTPISNFGLSQTSLLGQQPSLFAPQQHQNQIFQPQQQLSQPQQLQLFHQLQQSLTQQDLQINLQLEPDTYEQEYMKDLEEQFRSNIQPMNYGTQKYSINIAPSSNRVGINISRAPRSKPQNYLSASSSQYLSQNFSSRSQQFVRSSQTPREFNQFQLDQRQFSSLNTKSKAFNKKAFYVSCQNTKLRKLVTFSELGLDECQLMNYKVEDLISAIQQKLLKDDQNKYSAAYAQLTSNEPLQVLPNDTTLDMLEFNHNTTIAIIPHKKSIMRGIQEQNRKKNPNRPIMVGDKMKISPSLQDLQFMSDQELSNVEDFQVSTEFGTLNFLRPVDLRRVEIDRVIVFAQDEICFYPEDDGYVTPPPGQGLNVRCEITFFNFGSGQPEMQELKQNDFQAFEEKVREWTESLDMEILELTQDKLIVQVVGV